VKFSPTEELKSSLTTKANMKHQTLLRELLLNTQTNLQMAFENGTRTQKFNLGQSILHSTG